MSLRGFGRLPGAQIEAPNYLDIDTVSPPGRRLKFRPGKNFPIQPCGHPFRFGPVVDTIRSTPKLLKLLMAAAL